MSTIPIEKGSLSGLIAALTMLILTTGSARAQCVGDCNSDAGVSMTELVTAVESALGQAATCGAADPGGDGVTVDDIVAAVNSAVSGCAVATTPTPTATPTPTQQQPTATPSATATMSVAGCGDGMLDFAGGETCDDSNTADGDSCPANCRIATCALSGERVDVDVTFEVPEGIDIVGIQNFLRYPDGVLGIPGRLGSAQVFDRLSEAPDNVILQPNDLDYGLIMVAFSFDNSAIVPGRLFSVSFDRCRDARLPVAEDFRCDVTGAGDVEGVNVEGVTCAATLR